MPKAQVPAPSEDQGAKTPLPLLISPPPTPGATRAPGGELSRAGGARPSWERAELAAGSGLGGEGHGQRKEPGCGSPDDASVTSAAAGGISRPFPGALRDPATEGARPTWTRGVGGRGTRVLPPLHMDARLEHAQGAEQTKYLASG